jgi:hypothetical protein
VGSKKGQQHNTEENKKRFMAALETNLGLVMRASEATKIPSITHYWWLDHDPVYKAAVEKLIELKRDFVEKKLIGLVNANEPSCVTFTAKCLLAKRGYQQTTVIANPEGETFKVEISGLDVSNALKNIYAKADDDSSGS